MVLQTFWLETIAAFIISSIQAWGGQDLALTSLKSEGVIPLSTPLSQGVGYEKEKGGGYEIVAPTPFVS